MRLNRFRASGPALIAPALVIAMLAATQVVFGDEPGPLGRLFRFGLSGNAPASRASVEDPSVPPLTEVPVGARPFARSQPPSTPSLPDGPQPRILPQPRVSRPATEADPVVTRVTLARSDQGRQFGMFLQIFEDGTVIDSEGTHNLGRAAIRGVLDALDASELFRLKGHCGSPSTDYLESVQMIVYERNLGRLRANSFSFSGNPQGCDHAVKRLQAALDALQIKLNPPIESAQPNGGVAPLATPVGSRGPTFPGPASPPIRLEHADPGTP